MDSSFSQKIVVLGTGGTIAGVTTGAPELGRYRAGEVGIEEILRNSRLVGVKPHFELMVEQVCQIDSKDLTVEHWQVLLSRVKAALLNPEVKGLMITHGTDTLEETAFLLSWLNLTSKPVVLTGAMRAFDAHDSDGAQNLRDAMQVLQALIEHRMGGVRVVFAGSVYPGHWVQKTNAQSLNAFQSGPNDDRAELIEWGANWRPRDFEPPADVWPFVRPNLNTILERGTWPRVDVVMSHAGLVGGSVLQALVEQKRALQNPQPSAKLGVDLEGLEGLEGLVVAGTGSGTWSESMREPLLELMSMGVTVVLTSRVPWGHEELRGHPLLISQESEDNFLEDLAKTPLNSQTQALFSRLQPLKARIALALHLMG